LPPRLDQESLGQYKIEVSSLRQMGMCELNLLDLRPQTFGTFDVVIFAGVLHHRRDPFHVLKIIRDLLKDGGAMVHEMAVFVDENRLAPCTVRSDLGARYDRAYPTLFNLRASRTLSSVSGSRHTKYSYRVGTSCT